MAQETELAYLTASQWRNMGFRYGGGDQFEEKYRYILFESDYDALEVVVTLSTKRNRLKRVELSVDESGGIDWLEYELNITTREQIVNFIKNFKHDD